MTPIMKRTEKDSAVSPVVGVMLMLVVTIIIAAVVAVFASGVVTQTDKVPNTMLSADIDSTFSYGVYSVGQGALLLNSLGGDVLDLSKVSIKITKGDKSYAYENPTKDTMVVGQYLKPGITLNLVSAQGYFADNKQHCLSEDLGVPVNNGDVCKVTVIYNGQNILFEKEVIAS